MEMAEKKQNKLCPYTTAMNELAKKYKNQLFLEIQNLTKIYNYESA